MEKAKRNCPICGKEYETQIAWPLPVCADCADEWDRKIEKRESESAVAVNPCDPSGILKKRGLRPRYFSATFENFEIRKPEDKVAVLKCRKIVTELRGILVLLGDVGLGKTHLSSAMVKETGGKYMKMIEVAMYIRKAFSDKRDYDEEEALKALSSLPFLVIDEIEKTKGTANEAHWLSYILDERYANELPTVICGNLHLANAHPDHPLCEKCFESVVTEDILDRIRETGSIHYFTGESYRPGLRGKA